MKRWSFSQALALFALVLLSAGPALAVPPQQMTIQGQLKANGLPAPAGDYDITIRFWNAELDGVLLYQEPLTGVTVYDNGLFDARIGASTVLLSSTIFVNNSQLWLGIAIDAGPGITTPEPELPRSVMTSVGFAFAASEATTAQTASLAADLDCTTAPCVALTELDFDPATQAELDAVAALVPAGLTSVDQLSGGTITSDLTVSGYVTGTELCDGDGNCGSATASGCTTDQIMRWDGNAWVCDDPPPLLPTNCALGETLAWDGNAFVCSPPPQAATPPTCTGAYRALQFDGADYTCVDLAVSGLSGGSANGYEIVDSWGYAWDGVMRGAKQWTAAEAECVADGGRLPTATELWRHNSSTGTGEIGDQNAGDYLWTRIRYNDAATPTYFAFRLSDGNSTNYSQTTARPFRCVWPDRDPPQFDGNQCYGPPGAECWAINAEGGRYNMDMHDRAPLNPTGATRECAFYHAKLATQLALTEEIQLGLPNGTDEWLHTSDHEGFNGTNFLLGLVRWTGIELTFNGLDPEEAGWGYNTAGIIRPFRCTGLNYDPGVSQIEPALEWLTDTTYLKTTVADEAPAGYVDAIDNCRAQGGHLAYQRDYHELITAGLPGGSGTHIWASDTHSQTHTGIILWTGTDPSYTDQWATWGTWANRHTNIYAFRCVYYPVDDTYAGPPDSDCQGGTCYTVSVTVDGVTQTMWTDTFDRSPNVGFGDAVRTCRALGGHLPTHRDMAELIRSGMPNGSNQDLWTSDHTHQQKTQAVRWNGVDASWPDEPGVTTFERPRDNTARPYRCVWSNELDR